METTQNDRPSLWRQALANTFPSHEDIAARAYARYLHRRGAGGSAAQDWIEAERDLTTGRMSED